MKRFLCILVLLLSMAEYSYGYLNSKDYPCITSHMAEKMKPHLLPLKHRLKPILDKIFYDPRITWDEQTLNAAGFITVSVRPYSYVLVMKHPDLPGYLLKIYPDSETRLKLKKAGWEWFVGRCIGAKKVQKVIKSKKLRYFSVPDKWLYPLPNRNKYCKHPVVLVAKEMHLVSQKKSFDAWKNGVGREHLDELYHILDAGRASSYLPWNIPLTKEGLFSCIDTEHPDRLPKFSIAKKYLSQDMAVYWDKLVKNKGPSKKIITQPISERRKIKKMATSEGATIGSLYEYDYSE